MSKTMAMELDPDLKTDGPMVIMHHPSEHRLAAYDPKTRRKLYEWLNGKLIFDLKKGIGLRGGVCEVCNNHQAVVSYRTETNRLECLSCIIQRALNAEDALHRLDQATNGKGSYATGDGVFRDISLREDAINNLRTIIAHRKDFV